MLIEGEFESDLSKAVDNEMVANNHTNCEVSNCSLVTYYGLRMASHGYKQITIREC